MKREKGKKEVSSTGSKNFCISVELYRNLWRKRGLLVGFHLLNLERSSVGYHQPDGSIFAAVCRGNIEYQNTL